MRRSCAKEAAGLAGCGLARIAGRAILEEIIFLSALVLAFPAPMRAGRYKATIFCGVSKRLALPLRLRRNTPGRPDKARANDFLKLPARGRTRLRAGPFSV